MFLGNSIVRNFKQQCNSNDLKPATELQPFDLWYLVVSNKEEALIVERQGSIFRRLLQIYSIVLGLRLLILR